MKRRGIAYYIGQEARFNAAESDRWLKSGKLALPRTRGKSQNRERTRRYATGVQSCLISCASHCVRVIISVRF